MYSIPFFRILVLVALAPIVALAQNSGTTWTGSYLGEMSGVRVTMTLRDSDAGFAGTIVDPDGYLYNVEARVSGDDAAGELKDPKTGGTMDLKASRSGERITLRLVQMQLGVEFGNVINITFNKQDPALPQPPTSRPSPEELDQRLLGKWTYSDAYVSGNFSVATEITLVLRADGTYLYGNGQIAGGDGGGSFASGGDGRFKTGRWKCSNKTLFVDEGGGWTAYAEYLVDQTRLLMKFSDSSKKIWVRSN